MKEIEYERAWEKIKIYRNRMGIEDFKIEREYLEVLRKKVMELRNFEIELYWKRANYFWLFNAALLAALEFLEKNDVCGKYEDDCFHLYLKMLIGGLGIFFSLAWFLVNKGSKFWQQNWEFHLDQIERLQGNSLYDLVLCSSQLSMLSPCKEYPFSVSKVNQMVSFCVLVFWILVNFLLVFFVNENLTNGFGMILVFYITVIVGGICFVHSAKTSIFKEGVKDSDLTKGERMRIFSRGER